MFDINNPDERNLLPGISVHMMVKNPPIDRLAALVLFLLPHVQEVVIVDTGSDDRTIEKMKSWNFPHTAPVIVVHEEFEDFSTTRNKGLARHRYEWTLGIDPDELPSWDMLQHIKKVTSPAHIASKPNRAIVGYVYFTLNFWDGILGPSKEYHWHVRLWKTKGSYLYRPVHELVAIGGKPESALRGTQVLPKAPQQAYLIHAKGADEIAKADSQYYKMGEISR